MTKLIQENIAELLLFVGILLLGVSAFGYGGLLLLTLFAGALFVLAGSFVAWSNIHGRNF